MGWPNSNEAEIFDMVRRIDSPEARRQCIREKCGHDPQLQARIEALIKVYEEEAGFLREEAEKEKVYVI